MSLIGIEKTHRRIKHIDSDGLSSYYYVEKKNNIINSQQSIALLNKLWETSTIQQKRALLKARRLNLSWAQTKTIKEMVARGGGMIARDLLNLVRTYGKRNPRTNIRFKR